MNSFTEDDHTLPLDFNGSANPDQLKDVTFGTHLEYADGSVPMVTKTGSGRMSPVRARTMKEYDQQIAELKKENFSLKLRIYFLEERMQQKFDGEGEDLFKTNIELKVEVESLKKELIDKQELLKKASTALESISAQHQVELQQAQDVSKSSLEEQIYKLQKQLEGRDEEMESTQRVLADSQKQLLDLVTANKQLKNQLEAGEELNKDKDRDTGGNDREAELQDKDRIIRQLQSVLKTKERIIEQQEEEGRDALKDAQEQIEALKGKTADKSKTQKELDIQLEKLEQENKIHEENALKRDKAIQGLAAALQKKAIEVERLENMLNEKDPGGRESRQSDLLDLEDKAAELESMLREKQYENDRLQKVVSRRESEVQRLSQQLEKADDDLRQREDALQDAREKLREEKKRNAEKIESLTNHHQVMLDDAQRQLQNQEKMLQHLSKSLQDKDRQLHDYMHMIQEQRPQTEKQDSVINNLRSQLRDKEEAIEAAIEDKFKALEEKDTEVRQLKTALRERDRDIERANQMLLTTEETIDTLESEAKDRDQQVKQLTNQLKGLHRTNEEQAEEHQRSMEEKEAILQRLQNALNHKDRKLEDSIRASPSATDSMIQQLQERLQEKDKLLQEVMMERSKAAESGETASRHLLAKLRDREMELKEAQEKSHEEMTGLHKQIQNLQAELNKKDYELQTMENRASWIEEQQQEMIDKMRSAINEKDKTIQALVESAKEKDRLFRQIQLQSPEVYVGSSASKLAELQEAKDEVARLQNEMQKKEDLIERLQLAAERRSPKHDMVPRSQVEEAEEELGRRTENDLKKRVQGAGAGESEELSRLREENERLRQAAKRPGTPQRSQTLIGGETNIQLSTMMQDQLQEAKRLSDALRMEREIYVNMNQVGSAPQSDQARAFEIELSAVQALKQQLAEGVERNNKLRASLEKQMADIDRNQDNRLTDENKEAIESMSSKLRSLESQLEEKSRWNAALHTRLTQQATPSQHRDVGVGEARDSDVPSVPPSRDVSMFQDSFGFPHQSYLPSFRQLPDADLVPSAETLENMSPAELKSVISQLKEELRSSEACTEALQAQLDTLGSRPRDIPGENNQDKDYMYSGSQKLGTLEKEVAKLKAQLKHTEHLNDLLKQQIKLNTKSDNVPSGFNPELIVQMANEIQRLKDELEKTHEKLTSEKRSSLPVSSFTVTSPRGKKGAEAQVALQKQMESLRSELNQQKEQNRMLASKLASTEATVRSQTDKVRHFRGLLENAGMLAPLQRRSCSESSLSNLGGDSSKPPSGKGRQSSASTGNLSGEKASSDDMLSKLKGRTSPGGHKVLAKLRHRVEESRDLTSELLRQSLGGDVLNDESTPHVTTLKEKLGEAANLCTSMAVYLEGKDTESLHGSELDLIDLQTRHDEALHRIRQLETQLEQSSGTPPQGPPDTVALREDLAKLASENEVISQRSSSLEREVAKLRKQLSKEQKRSANDQEKLKASVEERDKLNANLRELLNENQVVGQKLQSELQRLRAEVKRLQKFEAEMKQGESKMADSIERVRHRTGESAVSYPSVNIHPDDLLDDSATSQHSPKWSSDQGSHKAPSDVGSIKMSPSYPQSPESRERARHLTEGSTGSAPLLPLGSPPQLDNSSLLEENPWSTIAAGSPAKIQQEMDRLRQQLQEMDAMKSRQVTDLENQLQDKTSQLNLSKSKLQEAHKDLRRLSEEVGRLHTELEEKHSMNNTLQMELGIYDKMHNDENSEKSLGSQVDLTLLLEELRQLRQQLVKTIENNDVLRQKLEEQLKQARPPTQIYHHYHNGPPDGEDSHSGVPSNNFVRGSQPFGDAFIERHERFTRVSGHSNGPLSINSHVSSESHAPPDQMDRLHETDVRPGHSTEDLGSPLHSQTWQNSSSIQQPMGSKASVSSEQLYLHGDPALRPQLNGGKGMSDNSMRYSIHDPMRPPKVRQTNGGPHAEADLSSMRVGSDLRSLYAIGELDDYELLKKEIGESISLLSGCEARVKERLKYFQRQSPSQNIEHATLRGVQNSLEQLAFCLHEQQRLIVLFWTSQLPRKDEQVNMADPTLTREKSHLQNQLVVLASKYAKARHDLATAEKRLEDMNNEKEKTEAYIIKKLNRHSDTLVSVEKNLEHR